MCKSDRFFKKFPSNVKYIIATIVTIAVAVMISTPLVERWSIQIPAPTLTEVVALSYEIADSKGVQMVFVPAGEFMMGSNKGGSDEQPVRQIFLDDYYIDKYEVTNVLYKVCVDGRVCDKPTFTTYYDNLQYAQHPVVWVSWDMANNYCYWRGAHLPTEAEWEKAARGTDERTYPWGEKIGDTYANYNNNVNSTTVVGSYPNGIGPYGAYDMAGNVWEWTADWYAKNYYVNSPVSNPSGPESGDGRVFRGGGWFFDANLMRSSLRRASFPSDTNINIGFRCARSP